MTHAENPIGAMVSSSDRSTDRSITSLAYQLHTSVPADRWCVTFVDLDFLREEVQAAVGTTLIQPPTNGIDDFDPSDKDYGPSMYTVNEQYIKPVTMKAGKMSWALMRNPNGLVCDLFISHAWQEGVFEFLSKVRHSWPAGVRTAWCCMLANPQNLDISFFLHSPSSSPFAVALRASEVMLVVPNRHQSVYTRLWCAYEAYLAQEEGKTILIAKSSNWRDILGALQWMVVAASLGGFLGTIATLLKAGRPSGVPAVSILVCGLSLVVDNDAFRQFMNLLGQMFSWIQVTHSRYFFHPGYKGIPAEVAHAVRVCYWLWFSIVFCVMEVDRVNSRSTRLEEEDLRQGYQGSIQSAKCSQEADAASIRTEIGDKVRDVDHAIEVLLSAGMSTPSLREIAHAVNIEQAAFSEITGAVFLLGPFASLAITATLLDMIYGGASPFLAVLPCVSVMARVGLFVLLCRSAWDEQRFILKLMSKCVAMLLWLFVAIVVLCLFPHNLSVNQGAYVWLLIADGSLLILLYIALLGIRGTAKLPLGLRILQVVFGRGRKAFLVCRRSEEFSDSESDSSGTDTDQGSIWTFEPRKAWSCPANLWRKTAAVRICSRTCRGPGKLCWIQRVHSPPKKTSYWHQLTHCFVWLDASIHQLLRIEQINIVKLLWSAHTGRFFLLVLDALFWSYTWKIIPVSKWFKLITIVSPVRNGCGTPSKWPFCGLKMGVILTTYKSWDDPPSK